MHELIKPWLGNDIPSDIVPLPRIIEITLSQPGADLTALRKKALSIAPDAEIDDHAQWISQYTSLLLALEWGLWVAAMLFLATTLAIVVLTTRASIKIHHRVIQILHTIGAFDSYIAGQFQFNAFLVAGRGALAGSFAALLFYLLLCFMTSGVAAPLLPSFHLGLSHVLLFALLPLLVGIGALISSRLTVLAELQRMP